MTAVQIGVLLALGTVGGLAVAVFVAAFQPSAPVRLDDALDRLDERIAPTGIAQPGGGAWRRRFDAQWSMLALRLPGSVPEADLKVIGWTRERFLVTRLTSMVQLAAFPAVAFGVLPLLGVPVPVWVPLVGLVIGAAVGFQLPTGRVKGRAASARLEMRHATASYLRQVALLSQSGAGVVSSLTRPTELTTSSWAFGRIRAQLDLARRAGEQPWEGLRRFGGEVDVEELSDLSDIAAGAGADGAAVVSTLIERADSLTARMQTEERADQNAASGKMSTPSVALVWIIAVWIGYPMISLLLLQG